MRDISVTVTMRDNSVTVTVTAATMANVALDY